MIINPFGEIIRNEWFKTTEIRNYVELDEFIVMPNHFHGIIIINDMDNVGVRRAVPLPNNQKFE